MPTNKPEVLDRTEAEVVEVFDDDEVQDRVDAEIDAFRRVAHRFPDMAMKSLGGTSKCELSVKACEQMQFLAEQAGWLCLADTLDFLKRWPDGDILVLPKSITPDQRAPLTEVAHHVSGYTPDAIEAIGNVVKLYMRQPVAERREIDKAIELWTPAEKEDEPSERWQHLAYLKVKLETMTDGELKALTEGLGRWATLRPGSA